MVGRGFNVQSMTAGIGRVGNAFGNLNSTLKLSHVLMLRVAEVITRDFVEGIVQLDRLEKAFGAVFGRLQGLAEFEYVEETADRLGIQITDLADAYLNLNAAAAATNLTSTETRGIFEAVSGAMAVLGRSTADTRGALRAVEQMISKGKVQAEELRGQLGERLPGAYITAAKAMGLTTQELEDQLKAGKILAEDFLPRFAKELKKTFSPEAIGGIRHLSAEWARLRNEIIKFYDDILDEGGLESIQGIVKGITKGLQEFKESWIGDLSLDILIGGFNDIARSLDLIHQGVSGINQFVEDLADTDLSRLLQQFTDIAGAIRGDAGKTGINLLDNTTAGALLSRTLYNVGLIPTLDEQVLEEERKKAEEELERKKLQSSVEVDADIDMAAKKINAIDDFTGSSDQSGGRWIKTLTVDGETDGASRDIDLFWRRSIDGRQWSRTFVVEADVSQPVESLDDFIKNQDLRLDDILSRDNGFLNEQFDKMADDMNTNIIRLKQLLRERLPEVLRQIPITAEDLDIDISNDSFITEFFEQYEELDHRTQRLVKNLHDQIKDMAKVDIVDFLNADEVDREAARIVAAIINIERQMVEFGADVGVVATDIIKDINDAVEPSSPSLETSSFIGEIHKQLMELIDPVGTARAIRKAGENIGNEFTDGILEVIKKDELNDAVRSKITNLGTFLELEFGITYNQDAVDELTKFVQDMDNEDYDFSLNLDVSGATDLIKGFVDEVVDLFSSIPIGLDVDDSSIKAAARQTMTIMQGSMPSIVSIPVQEPSASRSSGPSLPMDRSSVGTLPDFSHLAKETTSREIVGGVTDTKSSVDALKEVTTNGFNLLSEKEIEGIKASTLDFENQTRALSMGLDRIYSTASLQDLGDLAGLLEDGSEAAKEQAQLMQEMLGAQEKVAGLQEESRNKIDEAKEEVKKLNDELSSNIPKIGDGINSLEGAVNEGAGGTIGAINSQTASLKSAFNSFAVEISTTMRNGFLNMSSGRTLSQGGGIGGGLIDASGNRTNTITFGGQNINDWSAGVGNPSAQATIELMQRAQQRAEARARADSAAAAAASKFAAELGAITTQTSSLEGQIKAFKSGLQEQYPSASLDQLGYLIELQQREQEYQDYLNSGTRGADALQAAINSKKRWDEAVGNESTDLITEYKKMLKLQEELNELTSSVDENTGETALNTRDDELKDLIKPISQALAEERRKTGQTMLPLDNARFPSEALGDAPALRRSDKAAAEAAETNINVNFTNVDDQRVKSTMFNALRQGIPTSSAQASAFTNVRAIRRA